MRQNGQETIKCCRFSSHFSRRFIDENGIKPGSYSNNADKHVAESSRAEFLGINDLYSMFE